MKAKDLDTEAKLQALKEEVDKKMEEAWNKMGDTGSDEYLENCNKENFWFGYFRALEDIDDIHLTNLMTIISPINWVKTSDRLPKKNEWIITVDFSEENRMYNVFDYDNNRQNLYTHWMLLPDPPTNQEDK